MITTSVIQNINKLENVQTTNTESTINLPTVQVDSAINKPVNEFNNLSTTNKIIISSATGLVFLGIIGCIIWCCCHRSGRNIFGRRRQMEISYPITPQSPTLRRRR